MKSITNTDLQNFHNSYSRSYNKNIEKQVNKHGIEAFTLNRRIIRENPAHFNLKLPSYHVYDQHDSGRCWCFSSLNLIEGNIAKNLDIIPRCFALSANYITFFDKLEKTNYLYNFVLENNISLEKLRNTVFDFEDPITEGSYFINFINLVNKYGLVPLSAMPENQNTNNSRSFFLHLWREKTRIDALELYNLKSEVSAEKLNQLKKQKLYEVYSLLAKISGEPPQIFNYKYKNRSGRQIYLRDYSPIRFRDEFLTLNLNKFNLVRCDPSKKFYTKQIIKNTYSDNPFHPDVEYINLPKSDMKCLAVMQLKFGLPVKFGTRTDLFKHKKISVLDTRICDYNKLGIQLADYETGIITNLTKSQHSMLITGAQIENNTPIRWKVENTHAENQFYTMNDNFFDACVVNVSIHSDIIRQAGIDIK